MPHFSAWVAASRAKGAARSEPKANEERVARDRSRAGTRKTARAGTRKK